MECEDIKILKRLPLSERYHLANVKNELVFVKIDKSSLDFSLDQEFQSGKIVNQLESDHFLKTLGLVTVDKDKFPLVSSNVVFPRKALITEYRTAPNMSEIIYNLSFTSALELYLQVALVMWHANCKSGLQHRDLHSGNIVVQKLPKINNVRIGNFSVRIHSLCVIYDFGRAFIREPNVRYVISDLRTLRSSFRKRFKLQSEQIREILNDWERVASNGETDIIYFLDKVADKFGVDIRTDKMLSVKLDK